MDCFFLVCVFVYLFIYFWSVVVVAVPFLFWEGGVQRRWAGVFSRMLSWFQPKFGACSYFLNWVLSGI